VKTPKAEGPNEPSRDHRRKPDGAKPRRTGEQGPIGFGSVMRDVRGGQGGAGGGAATGGMPGAIPGMPGTTTAGMPVATTPGMPGFDPAQAQALQLDAGAQAAAQMGAVQSVGEQLADATYGVRDATEALADQDRSTTFQLQQQPNVPTMLGRMTPSALLTTVLDESRKLEIEEAMKELHVELEPEDLGPVVVRLRKGPDGTLDIDFRARQGDAARVLEQGTGDLRERLAAAGFASVKIAVAHDGDLQIGR
jgi:flagellar hook-length control protein FliK